MDAQMVRKACKYTRRPTAEQEQVLDDTLRLCRALYNVALEQRRTWWDRGPRAGSCRYPGPARGGAARPQGGPPGVRRPPLPGRARRAHPVGPGVAGLLPARAGGGNARLSALPGGAAPPPPPPHAAPQRRDAEPP